MKKQQQKERGRVEIIYALAQYCHPSWYHDILCWKTEWLRKLLEYYEKPEDDSLRMARVYIGVDFALGEDEQIINIFQWPFGYAAK
jgi:hypothetical protein